MELSLNLFAAGLGIGSRLFSAVYATIVAIPW
jgi:hypothetical protein